MPHITESIYQLYFTSREDKKSIHIDLWPKYDATFIDVDAEVIGDTFLELLAEVRKQKSQKSLALNAPIKEIILSGNLAVKFKLVEDELKAVIKAESIVYGGSGDIEVNEELKISLKFE